MLQVKVLAQIITSEMFRHTDRPKTMKDLRLSEIMLGQQARNTSTPKTAVTSATP